MGFVSVTACVHSSVADRKTTHSPNNTIARIALAACIALSASGCASMRSPERLYSEDTEMEDVRAGLKTAMETWKSSAPLSNSDARRLRNNIVAARKYAIDVQYTKYEAALTHEAQAIDFGAKAASIALGTTSDYLPVEHTARMIRGIGTGVDSLDLAYNDKVLRAAMIQNIQASMRTARHERATVLFANMRCSIKTYPMAMALSDLEAYYRAGTLPAGVMKLSQTVTKAENDAGANADAQKPGDISGQATLAGNAAEAKAKSDAANDKTKTNQKHRCMPEDKSEV